MPLPQLSREQRNVAEEKAVAVRQARRALLDDVKAGALSISSVLVRASTDPVAAKTKVSQLVGALPGYGPAKAVGVLTQAGITVDRRVDGLDPRQHEALINALG
jgi:hypothetical protein